jgi:hypothetical protein
MVIMAALNDNILRHSGVYPEGKESRNYLKSRQYQIKFFF